MKSIWVYVFASVLIFNTGEIFAYNVSININLDYLPDNVPYLKIYKFNVEISHCNHLEKINDEIFLRLQKNLTSFICNADTFVFDIFVYNSNILSALVTVENKNYKYDEFTSQLRNQSQYKGRILDYQPAHITFVVCQPSINMCQYRGIDNREILKDYSIKDLAVYSACKTANYNGSCITDIVFDSELIDIDKHNNILGTKFNVISSSISPQYGIPLRCLNGGILKLDNEIMKYQCDCPKTDAFIDCGPRCEVFQQSLESTQYFYNLPNSDRLIIEFSMFTPVLSGAPEIFRIHNRDNVALMTYGIVNSHIITSVWANVSVDYPTDTNPSWIDVSISVTSRSLVLRINEKQTVGQIMNASMNDFQLDTVPLIFLKKPLIRGFLCLSNLRVNSRIVDLYTPNYASCTPEKCKQCQETEKCFYLPLKSDDNAECICKPGFTKNSIKPTCHRDPSLAGQIFGDNNVSMTISETLFQIATVKFRTLLTHGNLAKFSVSSLEIFIGISNGLIYSNVFNSATNKSIRAQIEYYIVADGRWHSVQIEFRKYMLEITLDDKQPYNTYRSLFDSEFIDSINDINPLVNSLSFGPLKGSSERYANLSFCLDTLTFLSVSTIPNQKIWSITSISLNNSLKAGCDGGISCASLTCTDNRKCHDSWQNTSCVCEDNFTDQNGTCSFTKCISNPCLNNGNCLPSNAFQEYECRCMTFYSGLRCENHISVAFTSWWFILLVILLLLLIIVALIALKIRRRKRPSKKREADINAIYENTVECHTQAGETDYEGGPIDLDMLRKSAIQDSPIQGSPSSLHQQLEDRKQHFDQNNDELVLDYPLDYGYEGSNCETVSVSSFDSSNFDEALNMNNIPLQYV